MLNWEVINTIFLKSKPFLLSNPVLETLIFSQNPVLGWKTLLNQALINQITCITIVCMLNLKKVMETALASTISLRAIGGGVKIVRANHERADPNCRSHLKGAWKWWRREPLALTPFLRCGWCQPASGPASGTWLAWKTRSPTRSPACTPNGRTLGRSRYVASQLSEIVAKETMVK